MERLVWAKPEMNEVAFAANEYVAACGDPYKKKYTFVCDAPGGSLYWYEDGRGAEKTDWQGEFCGYEGAEYLRWSYHPCGAGHEVEVTIGQPLPFYDGFVDYNHNGWEDSKEAVIVWRGEDGNNGHATSNVKIETWETDKS